MHKGGGCSYENAKSYAINTTPMHDVLTLATSANHFSGLVKMPHIFLHSAVTIRDTDFLLFFGHYSVAALQ